MKPTHPLIPTPAIVFAVSLGLSAVPAVLGYLPSPTFHDEFAYLLQADTFAHVRLANPPHPMWQHFESFHVIQRPTYAAKFPPGQGAALALGQILGDPLYGAWLGLAAACAAVTWMLLAIAPRRWALFGGLMICFTPAIYHWGQCFWGGSVAMLGGALLCGTAARIAKGKSGMTLGMVAGVGVALLANSRPFEGLVVTLLVAAILAFELLVRRRSKIPMRTLTAMSFVLVAAAGFMLYYNWRVTGHATQLPYTLHARQHMVAPLMFWNSPASSAPEYRHELIRRYHTDNEWAEYVRLTTVRGFIKGLGEKFQTAMEYLRPWPGLAIAVSAGILCIRISLAARYALIVCCAAFAIEMACTPWMRMQYLAPLVGCFATLLIVGLRRISLVHWRQMHVGSFVVGTIVVLHLIAGAVLAARQAGATLRPYANIEIRAAAVAELIRNEPNAVHLVIVRYPPMYSTLGDIVYNGADIDRSVVIFARDMGELRNRELIDYYPNRRAWLLHMDSARLEPLGGGG